MYFFTRRGLKVVLLVAFCFNIQQTNQKGGKGGKTLTSGFGVVSFALDIAGTALSIVNFMDEQDDPEVTEEDLDRLREEVVQQVSGLITETESNVISVINLQQKVERLTDIKSIISSSLVDLERYLKTETDQTNYKDLFIQRFKEHDAILLIRELASLLTDTIPELSESMSSLIIETTNCNMTSLIEFEIFYGNLISQGITLEYANAKMNNLSLDLVEEYWDNKLTNIQNVFDSMESDCVGKFSASATEEVKKEISLEDLHENSNNRYNWKWNDVYQFDPRDSSSHLWNYFVAVQDQTFLFWNGPTQDKNNIIVFGDKNTSVLQWDKADVQSQLEANVSRFVRDIDGKKNAELLGTTIGTFINDINFVFRGIIVLYVDSNAPASVIIDDQYSPVAQVYVPINDHEGYNVYVYPEMWHDFSFCRIVYNEKGLQDSGNCGSRIAYGYVRKAMLYFLIIVWMETKH